jgi:glycosyltransferase involved in cell wall biosynthesis
MRILIVSPTIEDTHGRGLNQIARNLVESLNSLGHEVGLLAGTPHRKHFLKFEPYDAKIEHLYLQHYLNEGRGSFKYLVKGGYSKINLLKAIINRDIRKPRYINIEPELLSKKGNLLHSLKYCIISPYYYQFLVRNYHSYSRTIIKDIAKKFDIDLIVTTSPTVLSKGDLPERTKLIQFVHDFMPIELVETPPDNDTPLKFADQVYTSVFESDFLLANSQDTKNKVLASNPQAKVEVLFWALPKKHYDTEASTILITKNLQKNHYLVFASALEKRKNLENIMEAYSLVADKINMPLVLIGSPGYGFEDILKKYKSLPQHIQNNIIFTGYVSELDKYCLLKNATAMIFTTIYEGLGIPVIESMSCGTPVITTRIGGLPEACQDAAKYVDNPYNVAEIADAIVDTVSDGTRRDAMSLKGIELSSEFTEEKFIKRVKEVIDKVRG